MWKVYVNYETSFIEHQPEHVVNVDKHGCRVECKCQ